MREQSHSGGWASETPGFLRSVPTRLCSPSASLPRLCSAGGWRGGGGAAFTCRPAPPMYWQAWCLRPARHVGRQTCCRPIHVCPVEAKLRTHARGPGQTLLFSTSVPQQSRPPPPRRPGLGPTTAPSVRPYVLLSRSLPPFPHLARHTHSSSSSAVSPEQTGDSSRDMQVSANSAQRSWVIREISGQNAVPLGSHTLIDLQSHVLSEDSSHLISKM